MSYTVVPTVATGDVWTASNHNLYIRDNFRATAPDQVATKGQLIVGAGADALSLVDVGDDGDILCGDAGWISPSALLQMCDSNYTNISFAEGGSGNYHIPTYFDVPEGANWIYCRIEITHAATTASFILYPSSSTGTKGMEVAAHGSTVSSMTHGIMPLDSTGGIFYNVTDTVELADLAVYAWMY